MIDKDQKAFVAHCEEWLPNYHQHRQVAFSKYDEAKRLELVEHRKENAGMRAGNLYLLGELKKVHAENWRPDKDGNKPKPKQIPRQALTQEQRQQYTAKPTTGFLDNEINRIYNEQKGKVR